MPPRFVSRAFLKAFSILPSHFLFLIPFPGLSVVLQHSAPSPAKYKAAPELSPVLTTHSLAKIIVLDPKVQESGCADSVSNTDLVIPS